MRAVVVATVGALCLATPAVLRAARPAVVVTPPTPLLDEAVVVRVSGLRPDQAVVVRSSTPDADGREWNAEAVFRADAKGVVDLSTQAAASGSYTGVDAMGLLWSARPATPMAPSPPPDGQAAMAFPRPVSGMLETRLEAVVDGKVVASTTLERQITTVEINVTEVEEDGLVGRLYEPSGTRHPAVLVLSGGNGGIPPTYASVLAGRGYVAFALADSRAGGLPKDPVEIPLEYFQSGIEWLRARPSVDPERIAVLGISKGGERSLRLAAASPHVKAVVALSPSRMTWEGKIRGPILVVSSRDDGMWPAAVEHLHYESCAHELPDAWLPPSYGGALGGTAEGTMRAYGDYWPKLRAFLDRAIGPATARTR